MTHSNVTYFFRASENHRFKMSTAHTSVLRNDTARQIILLRHFFPRRFFTTFLFKAFQDVSEHPKTFSKAFSSRYFKTFQDLFFQDVFQHFFSSYVLDNVYEWRILTWPVSLELLGGSPVVTDEETNVGCYIILFEI
jgi:hypothetical protein